MSERTSFVCFLCVSTSVCVCVCDMAGAAVVVVETKDTLTKETASILRCIQIEMSTWSIYLLFNFPTAMSTTPFGRDRTQCTECGSAPHPLYRYLCVDHLAKHGYVIKPSTIVGAGNGLFVAPGYKVKSGDTIDIYQGKVSEKTTTTDDNYALDVNYNGVKYSIDGKHGMSLAPYANTLSSTNELSFNAAFNYLVPVSGYPIVALVASRDLENEEEIFVDYGPFFRIQSPVASSTLN